jgi:hypothetical protein
MKTYGKLFGTAHVTLKKSFVKGAITAALLFIGVLTADADSISIPNASFELSGPAQTSTDPKIAPGWVFTVQGGSAYGIGTISSNFSSPGTSTGSNYAFINNDYPNVSDSITTSASLGEITADTTYTLTVAVGNPNGTGLYEETGNFGIGLTANGSVFALDPIAGGSIANGTFQDFSYSFTTPVDASYAGQDLGILLASAPETDNAFQPSFDNVRLDATDLSAAPEPKAWALFMLGAGALYWLLRRKRTMAAVLFAMSAAPFIGALSANADALYVPNYSFELSGPAETSTDPSIATGWTFNVQGGSDFGVGTISSVTDSPGTSTGSNYAFINCDVPGALDTLSTSAEIGILSDTTYTLTVAIGNFASGLSSSTYDAYFGLTANGNPFVVDPIAFGSIPEGTFEDFTFSFTTPVDYAAAGQTLGIVLAAEETPDAPFQAAFDNVRLDASDPEAVPEPATWALLLLGALVLCWSMRPKRGAPAALIMIGTLSFIAIGLEPTSAASVDVPDNSFETGDGWTYSDPDIVPGWIFNAPTGSSYGSLFQGACFTAPDGSEGNQFAFIDNDVAGTEASLTSASSLGTIAADTTYTLTVALGSPDAVFQGGPLDFDPVSGVAPAAASLELLANGQPFAVDTIPAGMVASGTWQDFSLAYTTTDSDPVVGEQLTLQLGTDLNPGEAEEASFDNVRLDASPSDDDSGGSGGGDGDIGSGLGTAPEPPVWGLLGIGLAAFGSLARWRSWRNSFL